MKNFIDPFQLSGFVEVDEQRKVLPYTITTIGDASALGQWRTQQAVKEIEWQKAQAPKRADRRANAIAAVEAQDGRASKEVLKQAYKVKQERKERLIAAGKLERPTPVKAEQQVWVPTPEPTIIQKAVKWLKGLINV